MPTSCCRCSSAPAPRNCGPLRWDDVDLDGHAGAIPPVPPSISVLRAVRVGGDTKTRKSRRRLVMPQRCVIALRLHRDPTRPDTRRSRARVRLRRRHGAGRPQRSTLVPSGREGSGARCHRLDTSRDAAQLRITAVGVRGAAGAHLTPGWAQRHGGHGGGLPSAAPASAGGRCDRDGRDLPNAGRRVVTQIVARWVTELVSRSARKPLRFHGPTTGRLEG